MLALSSLTLSDPMDCSLPGSSVCGTFQARILEWVAISKCKSHQKHTHRHLQNMFDQILGYHVDQSSWHMKLTTTKFEHILQCSCFSSPNSDSPKHSEGKRKEAKGTTTKDGLPGSKSEEIMWKHFPLFVNFLNISLVVFLPFLQNMKCFLSYPSMRQWHRCPESFICTSFITWLVPWSNLTHPLRRFSQSPAPVPNQTEQSEQSNLFRAF